MWKMLNEEKMYNLLQFSIGKGLNISVLHRWTSDMGRYKN